MASARESGKVYSPAVIARTVSLAMVEVGTAIKETLTDAISRDIEGRCIVEGFVQPGTVRVESFSAGVLEGARVVYRVAVGCQVCCPVEGTVIDCVARNVTKAGIRAEIDQDPTPMMIFLARDHHHRSAAFAAITVGATLQATVLGQRFELNDSYVSVIAILTPSAGTGAGAGMRKPAQPRLTIREELS
jgi:hypothetical protein